MTRMRKDVLGIVAMLAAAFFSPAVAQIINGGFETGDLTGWNQFSSLAPGSGENFQVVTGFNTLSPSEGTYMALVEPGPDSIAGLYTNAFDWSVFEQVCADVRLLTNELFLFPAFQAVADAPPVALPLLAVGDVLFGNYGFTQFFTGGADLMGGGGLVPAGAFAFSTPWLTFCWDPANISFASGDPTTEFSWLVNGSVLDTALLIDNVRTVGAPPPPDADGDGVLDADDVCPATVIPESVPTQELKINHYALVDGDTTFDTNEPPNGGGPGLSFTVEDTAGCSCEQIIVELGLGAGHAKFGCSISSMDTWVDLVSP